MTRIRNSAKAIILQDGCILAIQKEDELGDYYILPGGGQHYGEPLPAAVRREVMEETALDVSVGDVLFIRDYISQNHEFAATEKDCHQVEFMFACQVTGPDRGRMGDEPDGDQVGIKWIPLAELMEHRLYPLSLRPFLIDKITTPHPVYLGDIN